MKKTILYIAMSLDGYIADKNGGVNWLGGHGENAEPDNSYAEFVEGIDAVIMGRTTYEQIINELSPNAWVYDGMTGYVFTSKPLENNKNVTFVHSNLCEFIHSIKPQEGKNIWIVGGAKLIAELLENDMIDEYYIAIMPTLLGSGIRLFSPNSCERKLHLDNCNVTDGVTMLKYSKQI